MIYELTISRPKKTPIAHWTEVPWLKDRKKIVFEPGLNIVYGSNGTGKSTLLLALATLMHCREENWPRVTKSSLDYFNRPTGFADGMMLVHDGQPCRYLGVEDPGFTPTTGVKALKVELESTTMSKPLDKQSSGQASLTKLVRFIKAEPQKVKYQLKEASLDDAWKPLWQVGTAALKNVAPRSGVPKQHVLLLDEVDRSLDFAKQAAVWKQIRTLVADGKHQVIVASHSPFAVSQPGAHYIETSEGYLEASRKALSILLRDAAREAA